MLRLGLLHVVREGSSAWGDFHCTITGLLMQCMDGYSVCRCLDSCAVHAAGCVAFATLQQALFMVALQCAVRLGTALLSRAQHAARCRHKLHPECPRSAFDAFTAARRDQCCCTDRDAAAPASIVAS